MKLTEAEWQIMNALWQGFPVTARQLAARLPKDVTWAYTTIKTLLARLVEKHAVQETKQGNTSLYEPLISQAKARKSALRSLVDLAFDGALGPLMHFLVEDQNLSEKQRKELIELLQSNDKPLKGGSL